MSDKVAYCFRFSEKRFLMKALDHGKNKRLLENVIIWSIKCLVENNFILFRTQFLKKNFLCGLREERFVAYSAKNKR